MSDWLSLTQLLHSGRQAQHPVAWRENGAAGETGEVIVWQDFYARVCHWYQLCQQYPDVDVWGLYLEDSLEFGAALLALWQLRKCACIPGDNLPGTLNLLSEHVDGLLGDFETSSEENPKELPHLTSDMPPDMQTTAAHRPGTSAPEFTPLDRQQLAAMVFTSGTTGTPKSVPVLLRQLDDEVQMHEQLWGSQLQQASVVATVSHQHLYGLLHKLLWPLAAGRPFIQTSCRYLEQLASYAQQHKALAVITTPSHLSRIPPSVDWQAIKDRWVAVISSTAPLSLDASQAAKTTFGTPVTEIFGSSETGGIAWRQQTENEHWQALPGIHIDRDSDSGALAIQSPLLADNTWLHTSDRIELMSSNSFRMLGRIDRIAKIEGKRVSLSAIEQQLVQHPWVEQCRAIVFQERTAVVASLNTEGTTFLQEQGKRALNQQLRNFLTDHFETPVLPRRWRYPAQLPENAQGKVTLRALESLFSDDSATNNATKIATKSAAETNG